MLIAHRGNTRGSKPLMENKPDYIDDAISQGYDAEVDLWYENGELLLGHDSGEHKIGLSWLKQRQDSLWVHCKSIPTLQYAVTQGLHCFYHEYDPVVLTSGNFLWCYPGQEIQGVNVVCVLPEVTFGGDVDLNVLKYKFICSDYVGFYDQRD